MIKSLMNKGRALAFGIPMSLFALTSCVSTSDPGPVAALFFFNAASRLPQANLRINESIDRFNGPLAYGNLCCTSPSSLEGGILVRPLDTAYTFAIYNGTDTTTQVLRETMVEDRHSYFFVLWNSINGTSVNMTQLERTRDGVADSVLVRFFNAAYVTSGGSALDVYLTDVDADLTGLTPDITGLSYGDLSNYYFQSVKDGEVQIRFTDTGTKTERVFKDNRRLVMDAGLSQQLLTVIIYNDFGEGVDRYPLQYQPIVGL